MIIRISSKFKKSYRKLPRTIKEKAKEKEQLFRVDQFDSRLDTHKLHGRYKQYWAFTVFGQYRIMFIFVASGRVDFINIGNHAIYK